MKKYLSIICIVLLALCVWLFIQNIQLSDAAEFYQNEYRHLSAVSEDALVEKTNEISKLNQDLYEIKEELEDRIQGIKNQNDKIKALNDLVASLEDNRPFYKQVEEAREPYVHQLLLEKRQELDLENHEITKEILQDIIDDAIDINNEIYARYGTMGGDKDPTYSDVPELEYYVVVDKYKSLDEIRNRLLETYTKERTEIIISETISFDLNDQSKPYIYYDDKLFTMLADRGSDMYTEVYKDRLIAQEIEENGNSYVIRVMIPYVSLTSDTEPLFSTSFQNFDIEFVKIEGKWKVNSDIRNICEN